MRFFTNLVPLRLELSESASLGDSYHVRRVRLNLMTLAVNSNAWLPDILFFSDHTLFKKYPYGI